MESLLNPALDTALLAKQYKSGGRVRIENVLKPEVVEKIADYLRSEIKFDLIFVRDGKTEVWTPKHVASKSREELAELQQAIWGEARKGIGFQYGGYAMATADKGDDNDKLRYLYSVFDYVNGKEMIDLVSHVTGRSDLLGAKAQYTRFIPGQFLTRHRDVVTTDERRIAYVLGFNPTWHPDWGGLLQFYQQDGTPLDAWAPHFNCLNLFDIDHIHAVTCIAPFSGDARLSLTGWFTSQPSTA
jgi:Rps23 Pro-64 3,4-dihydroxylase Tpa1-like proline 4-hydroxylase